MFTRFGWKGLVPSKKSPLLVAFVEAPVTFEPTETPVALVFTLTFAADARATVASDALLALVFAVALAVTLNMACRRCASSTSVVSVAKCSANCRTTVDSM